MKTIDRDINVNLFHTPQNENAWYNYKTGSYEYIDTPSDFSDYIPQDQPSQGVYQCMIALGYSPIDSAMRVLSIHARLPVGELKG